MGKHKEIPVDDPSWHWRVVSVWWCPEMSGPSHDGGTWRRLVWVSVWPSQGRYTEMKNDMKDV